MLLRVLKVFIEQDSKIEWQDNALKVHPAGLSEIHVNISMKGSRDLLSSKKCTILLSCQEHAAHKLK